MAIQAHGTDLQPSHATNILLAWEQLWLGFKPTNHVKLTSSDPYLELTSSDPGAVDHSFRKVFMSSSNLLPLRLLVMYLTSGQPLS